jgi:hypothetical protein
MAATRLRGRKGEYHVDPWNSRDPDTLGAQGWELVSVAYDVGSQAMIGFYKRPKR